MSRRDSRIPAAAGAPRNPSATGDLRNPAATGEMQVPAAAGLRSRAGSASASRNGRSNGGAFATDGPDALSLRLAYRPPLDWPSLLDVLRAGALPGVDHVVRRQVAEIVAAALRPSTDEAALDALRDRAMSLAAAHPLYPSLKEQPR